MNNFAQSFQQSIIPELETRLRSKCETLASFHKPTKQGGMSHYLFLVNGPSLCLMPDNIIHALLWPSFRE